MMTALQVPAPTRNVVPVVGTVARVGAEAAGARAARFVFAGLRIGLSLIFLWAFLDKLFGLGHETASAGAWINGGNPTKGFLANGAKGPFADFYHWMAGASVTNWLFMVALAGIGVALLTGIGMRIAAVSGVVLMVMMWSVVLPPANHVFLDDHSDLCRSVGWVGVGERG